MKNKLFLIYLLMLFFIAILVAFRLYQNYLDPLQRLDARIVKTFVLAESGTYIVNNSAKKKLINDYKAYLHNQNKNNLHCVDTNTLVQKLLIENKLPSILENVNFIRLKAEYDTPNYTFKIDYSILSQNHFNTLSFHNTLRNDTVILDSINGAIKLIDYFDLAQCE